MTLRTSISGAEQARMLDGTGKWMYRVRVKRRTDLSWTDATNVAGGDWVVSISADIDTPDTPVTQFAVKFIRAADGHSLAPGISASDLNQTAGAVFSPIIYPGHLIEIDAYCAASGEMRAAAVWHPWVGGTIREADFPDDDVSARCISYDGMLQRVQIEAREKRGAPEPGTPFAEEFQGLLDRWNAGVTLLLIGDPDEGVGEYVTEPGSLGDFLLSQARRIGWDARYRWSDADGAFRYMLYLPPRTKTTPDLDLSNVQVFDVPDLSVDMENLRNAFTLIYPDAASGEAKERTTEDAPSIAEFGREWMGITEAQESPIDSAAKADALLAFAKNDLHQPLTNKRIRMPFIPFLALHHMIRIQPDNQRFDYSQDYSVVGGVHQADAESGAESLPNLRGGSPVGMYYAWQKRGGTLATPDHQLYGITFDNDLETDTHFAIVFQKSPGVKPYGAAPLITGQPDDAKWAESAAAVAEIASPFMVPKPSPALDQTTLVQMEARYIDKPSGNLLTGQIWRKPIPAPPANPPAPQVGAVESETQVTLFLQLQDFGLPILSVEFRAKIGGAEWGGWEAPTRVEGEASVVNGGTLAALQVEYDSPLATRGFTKIQYRYSLLGSAEPITSDPISFDRDRIPTIIEVRVVGTRVTIICDFNDTLSVALESGDWRREADGYTAEWDVVLDDPDGDPGIGAEIRSYRAWAYQEPKGTTHAGTPDYRDIIVSGAGAPAAPEWTADTDAVAPDINGDDVSIHLQATSAPVGSTVRVMETHTIGSGGWSAETDVTSALVPSPTTPPTSLTAYAFDTPYVSREYGPGFTTPVTYVFTTQIRDSGGGVLASTELTATWFTGFGV